MIIRLILISSFCLLSSSWLLSMSLPWSPKRSAITAVKRLTEDKDLEKIFKRFASPNVSLYKFSEKLKSQPESALIEQLNALVNLPYTVNSNEAICFILVTIALYNNKIPEGIKSDLLKIFVENNNIDVTKHLLRYGAKVSEQNFIAISSIAMFQLLAHLHHDNPDFVKQLFYETLTNSSTEPQLTNFYLKKIVATQDKEIYSHAAHVLANASVLYINNPSFFTEKLKLLKQNGADLNIPNSDGKFPYQIVQEEFYRSVQVYPITSHAQLNCLAEQFIESFKA